jgi:glycerol uptake facilitator-like aquaporin
MIRRLSAEALGTAFLLIGVVGSGIMAQTLSPDNTGVALLANAIATGAILYVIITIFGPVSGAHFNPAVTLVFVMRGELTVPEAMAYIATQIAAAIIGVWVAHAMFDLPIWQLSGTVRSGPNQWFSEVVATFGLVLVILGGIRHANHAVPPLVAIYITGAYWFTSSTSFANPAVTIARSLSDTFAGILPGNIAVFIGMQLIGAVAAALIARHLFAADPDV